MISAVSTWFISTADIPSSFDPDDTGLYRYNGTDRYHRQMTMITGARVMTCCSDDLVPAAALFRGLADPTRLAILRRLTGGELRVVDLTRELGTAQSTVSTHLACLRDCGLVTGRPEGRQVFYALARPELLDLLASAERLLTLTGSAVALCPNYGMDSCAGDERSAAAVGDEGSHDG